MYQQEQETALSTRSTSILQLYTILRQLEIVSFRCFWGRWLVLEKLCIIALVDETAASVKAFKSWKYIRKGGVSVAV